MGSKMENLQKKKDRISALPDSIIHDILSFLPSTKEAVRTSVLSKRWQKQWKRVPVLIFHLFGMSYGNLLEFFEKYKCSKIKKVLLEYGYSEIKDPLFAAKIGLATRKDLEELILVSTNNEYILPNFVFDNASLVKLKTHNFNFIPDEKVKWRCLVELKMGFCRLPDQAMQHILSGCPVLQSFELSDCFLEFDKLVIASESLKRLVLENLDFEKISTIEISCPNLVEISLHELVTDNPKLFVEAIKNVLSSSLLLVSFEFLSCSVLDQLVIASPSLKRLVLGGLRGSYVFESKSYSSFDIEISCPKLEELKLSYHLNVITLKLLNLTSSLRATVDFFHDDEWCGSTKKTRQSLIQDILKQLHHIKELKIGSWFFKVLSALEPEGVVDFPVLNIKCLTLISPDLKDFDCGFACLLRNSPMLEKLVINLFQDSCYGAVPKLNYIGECYWSSNSAVSDRSLQHLKTIEIIGFPIGDGKQKIILKFVQFLLKNAKVLKNMFVILRDHGATFTVSCSRIVKHD